HGAIRIDAAAGLVLSEAGDLSSLSGSVSLDAGAGSLAMTAETVVDAGSGAIALEAGGAITLGKLRTTGSADLTISGAGIIDAGEGAADIIARDARLVIVSSAGIGSADNGLETEVAVIDLSNSGSGDIVLEDADSLVLERVR